MPDDLTIPAFLRRAHTVQRRLSEIDDALARPVEEGRDWDVRRRLLEREQAQLRRQ